MLFLSYGFKLKTISSVNPSASQLTLYVKRDRSWLFSILNNGIPPENEKNCCDVMSNHIELLTYSEAPKKSKTTNPDNVRGRLSISQCDIIIN